MDDTVRQRTIRQLTNFERLITRESLKFSYLLSVLTEQPVPSPPLLLDLNDPHLLLDAAVAAPPSPARPAGAAMPQVCSYDGSMSCVACQCFRFFVLAHWITSGGSRMFSFSLSFSLLVRSCSLNLSLSPVSPNVKPTPVVDRSAIHPALEAGVDDRG